MTGPSISETFADLRARKRIGLMPFIPAGYPDLETTAALLPAMQMGGASLIEVGIPFSDPIADGPVIQEAFNAALAKKVRVADVLKVVATASSRVTIPMVAMVSYSIVYRYGLSRFVADAKAAGFAGLIIPDLPPPEAQAASDVIRAGQLDTVLFVAPTTTTDRRREIMRLSSGFVYYLSVLGITGERDTLPDDVIENVRSLRAMAKTPVCVGFGISRSSHVKQLQGVADGAIVGSALVKRLRQAGGGPENAAKAVEGYCRELLSEIR